MKSLEELEAALDQPDTGLAEFDHANPKRRREALDRLVGLERRYAGVARALALRLEVEDNPYVLSRALTAAGRACPGGEGCVAGVAVAKFLTHADARVVANAIDALRHLGDRSHADAVRKLTAHASNRVRANAAVYLGHPDAAPVLAALLTARDPVARRSGLWALRELGVPDCLELVVQTTRSSDPDTAHAARALLKHWSAAGGPAAEAYRALVASESTPGETFASDLRVPALSKRAWAWLADSVILGALALAALFALNTMARKPIDPAALAVNTQLVMLAYSIAFFMRDGLGGGRGLAKRYLGLRVIDRERGTGCGFVSSMIRQATFYLPLVNVCEVVWAGLDPEGCRLVDRLLGTQVIDEKNRDLSKLDRALLFLFGGAFALGSGAVFLMAIAGDLGLLRRWVTW